LRVKILVPIVVVILASGTLLSWMVHRELEEVLTRQFSDRMEAILSDRTYGVLMQKLADCLRMTGAVDVLLNLAQEDAGLRRVLFLSVSGEESYRRIFREGFQFSRMTRILQHFLRQKILGSSPIQAGRGRL
jgi:hypothetical protein